MEALTKIYEWLRFMVARKASDLFITAGFPPAIKLNGKVTPITKQSLTPTDSAMLAKAIMSEKQHADFLATHEANFAIHEPEIGRFRVNIFMQQGRTGMVLRHINTTIPKLEDLHLPPGLKDISMMPRGLVIVVGATGSGKSTTLAAMVGHRNQNAQDHIVTVEDPIEYVHTHGKSIITQREVGMDTLDWEAALKNTLRQAPDVIMIGEIRDRDTMQAAIAYAQTGHLCLATLHANNAYHALNRIFNFFPMENRPLLYMDLAATLKCIISQRLVKRPDGKRIPAVEILLNSRQVAELIERGEISGIREAMEQSLASGSRTFEQDLFRLYRDKIITLEEALANADSPTNLSWLINNAQFSDKNADKTPLPSTSIDSEPHQEEGGASFKEFTLELDED